LQYIDEYRQEINIDTKFKATQFPFQFVTLARECIGYLLRTIQQPIQENKTLVMSH
jgi:hypothetical protein